MDTDGRGRNQLDRRGASEQVDRLKARLNASSDA